MELFMELKHPIKVFVYNLTLTLVFPMFKFRYLNIMLFRFCSCCILYASNWFDYVQIWINIL